jgi:hypothetical protein
LPWWQKKTGPVTNLNPQAKQMANESMVRNLDAQARAIWPPEIPLLRRHLLPSKTDLFLGRDAFGILAAMKLTQIQVDYIVVDTLRVPRETFAAIIEARRDGHAEAIGEYSQFRREEAVAYFNQMIANILDPRGYAVWMVPVVSARLPF